jgi:hypothetical protein
MMVLHGSEQRLTRQARERFVDALDGCFADLGLKVQTSLSDFMDSGIRLSSTSEAQRIIEAARQFEFERQNWINAAHKAWHESRHARGDRVARDDEPGLELEDEAVIECKILASRLANAVSEAAGPEINNLKLRVQHLEQTSDWSSQDVLRPETLALVLVKAWLDCGLKQPMWNLALPAIQSVLTEQMTQAYRAVNQYLIDNDVMAEIDLRALVKRDRKGRRGGNNESRPTSSVAEMQPGSGYASANPWRGDPRSDVGADGFTHVAGVERQGQVNEVPLHSSMLARAAQETRMLTGVTPVARIRQRTQGVLGQLRRMLADKVSDYDVDVAPTAPSPRLAQALAAQVASYATTEALQGVGAVGGAGVSPVQVRELAVDLRQRAAELKAKAEKPSEKAIIEIVALMFQAILAEERIPPSIRVWFARLQFPVLRLALAEPDFFASVEHPARQLIDRMGACALGFDVVRVGGNRLESEVRRVVQVIEQYPETGRRVYQLMLDEFKKFLGHSLTEDERVRQVVTLAQQIEQKEALSIQYTIELRRMLDPVPVSDDVREFLLRIWSDVLALAAVRGDPQQAETPRFKQAASDLVWSVCPRIDRAERSQMVQQLAGLLAVLREGMTSLAIPVDEQNGHIKRLNNAVMRAFVSRAEPIAQSALEDLARGLAGLEDMVTDDPQGDVLLDPGVIELMFGIEGDALEVISTGGSQPTEGMLQWARELDLGTWFSLELQGVVTQVQYVWRSARGQLHLLANSAGKSYLVQTRRLASYLQAGLLVPVEDEALTVRATRDALAKLNAAPDQLLH